MGKEDSRPSIQLHSLCIIPFFMLHSLFQCSCSKVVAGFFQNGLHFHKQLMLCLERQVNRIERRDIDSGVEEGALVRLSC
jgi:hypothetical protein